MTNLTRKGFLGLAAATAAAAPIATGSAKAQPTAKTARPTLIKDADILSMDAKLGSAEAMDVRIVDGKIAEIGKGLAAAGAEVVEASGHILMPGMVDGHRHVWEVIDLARVVKTEPAKYAGYQTWKMRTIVSMKPEDHHLAGLVGGLLAINSGVTSLLDYAHGQIDGDRAVAAAKGLKESGIGGWFALQLGVSSSYKPGDTVTDAQATKERISTTTEVHWATVARLQKEVFSGGGDLLQLGLAPAAGTGDPLTTIKAEFDRARATGVKMIAAHIHKPPKPFGPGVMGHRDSGITDLHEAGLLGPDYHVSHANRLTPGELEMLRATGGMLCATAMGEFPYMTASYRGPSSHGRARAAGVATGIGQDVSLALTMDYFEHCRAAFWNLYLEEEGRKIAGGYKSEDTLDFATALGAKGIRLGDVTGSVTVGKRADLVLLRTDRLGFPPPHTGSLADRVLNFATTADIDSVWVAGVAKKRAGKMVGVDFAKLRKDLEMTQARIARDAATITFT